MPLLHIEKAYKILDTVTPFDFDCGEACDKRCCKGDVLSGMELFPFEDEYLRNTPGFTITKNEKGIPILLCGGECCRERRPLLCRVFPLSIHLKNERSRAFDLIFDPRGHAFCPIVYDEIPVLESFLRAVKKAFSHLLKDDTIYAYLKDLSADLEEYAILSEKLRKT